MAFDALTPSLKLLKQGTGNNNAAWGDNLNTQVIDRIETAFVGVTSFSGTGAADIVLTDDQALSPTLVINGTLTADQTIVLPAYPKNWTILNNCSGNFYVLVRVAGSSVARNVPQGKFTDYYSNGATVYRKDAERIGELFYTASASVPAGALECNGGLVKRASAVDLFAALGTTWGAGDGFTTFGLPNATNTGRFLRSRMSGVAVGTYQSNQNQAHTHTASGTTTSQSVNHTHTGAGNTGTESAAHTHTGSGTTSGISTNHNHPYAGTSGIESVDHSHSFSATSGATGIDHSHTGGGTTSTMSATHTHAGSGQTGIESFDHTHAFSGTSAGVSTNHTHGYSGTTSAMSAYGTHAHSVSGGVYGGTNTINVQQQAASNIPGTYSAIVVDAAYTDHTHSFSGTTGANSVDHSHTYSGTTGTVSQYHSHAYSFTTGTPSSDHTHSYSFTTSGMSIAASHTHTVTGTTGLVSQYHTHNYSGTTSQNSVDHTHTYGFTTGTETALHYHSYSFTTSFEGSMHTHDYSFTTSSNGGTEARPEAMVGILCVRY